MTCADDPCAPWAPCLDDPVYGHRCICPRNFRGARCYDCAPEYGGKECGTRFLTSTIEGQGNKNYVTSYYTSYLTQPAAVDRIRYYTSYITSTVPVAVDPTRYVTSYYTSYIGGGGGVTGIDPTRYYTSYYTSFKQPKASIHDPFANGQLFIEFVGNNGNAGQFPRATPTQNQGQQFRTKIVVPSKNGEQPDVLAPNLPIAPVQPGQGGRLITSTVVQGGRTRLVLVREYTDLYLSYYTVGQPGGAVEYSTIPLVSYVDRILPPNVITSYLTSTLAVKSTRYITSTLQIAPKRKTLYSTVQQGTVYVTSTYTSTIKPSVVTR